MINNFFRTATEGKDTQRHPARHSRSGLLPSARIGQAGGGEEEEARAGIRRGPARRSPSAFVRAGQHNARFDRQSF